MSKFKRKALLLTCILSLQIMKSIMPLHANTMILTYDGKQHTYNKPPITLHIDDKKIDMPVMPPVQIDGRTLVPTREVFEPMGASVEWKTAEKKVFVNHGETLMILELDNQDVWIDGEITQLDVPPKIINDKLMLPLRFIGETLGYQVDWEQETNNINIKQNEPEPVPPDVIPPLDTGVKPETNLISVVDMKVNNMEDMVSAYTIYFEEAIDSFTDFQQTGKIVIDINNAKNLLASSITLPQNPYVETVRTSQFTASQTRVVFDLKAGASSNIELSRDRMSLTVQIYPLVIEKVSSGINAIGEFILFSGITQSQVKVSTLENPDRLVIDLPMSVMSSTVDLRGIEGENVNEVRTSINEEGTRIVLGLNQATPYEIVNNTNEVMIQLAKPIETSARNIKYISAPQETFMFKKAPGLTTDQIKIKDDYRNRQIIITLPENYSDLYDDGIVQIGSQSLNKITVKSDKQTEFIIDEKQIQAFDIIDDGENIQIVFMPPREKYDKIIVLDLGHGAQDNGASGNGLIEKTLNFQQGMVTYELLEKDSRVKVYITREDDSYPTNPSRAILANEIGADIFVSMHNNSFSPQAKGTEVLYSTSAAKSKQIAEIVQKNMVSQLGTYNRGVKPRPDLIVLNATKMPAILIETAFLSNPEDAAKLKSPEFNKKVGLVVYESIIEIFNTVSFR